MILSVLIAAAVAMVWIFDLDRMTGLVSLDDPSTDLFSESSSYNATGQTIHTKESVLIVESLHGNARTAGRALKEGDKIVRDTALYLSKSSSITFLGIYGSRLTVNNFQLREMPWGASGSRRMDSERSCFLDIDDQSEGN